MKIALLLSIAWLGSFAYGSHTVCSSPNLYFASVRHDFGTQPPKGTETGKLTILVNGKLLDSITYTQGQENIERPKYSVSLTGEKNVLLKQGNQTAGTTVFTTTALVKASASEDESTELKTSVICESKWALVP